MSETGAENKSSSCSICGKPTMDAGTGGIVHVNGGDTLQTCGGCGWTGGQVERFVECPRCGDGTQLIDDHRAS